LATPIEPGVYVMGEKKYSSENCKRVIESPHHPGMEVSPYVLEINPNFEYVPAIHCHEKFKVTKNIPKQIKVVQEQKDYHGLEECISLTGKPDLCKQLSEEK
jgi:hypothetical protein